MSYRHLIYGTVILFTALLSLQFEEEHEPTELCRKKLVYGTKEHKNSYGAESPSKQNKKSGLSLNKTSVYFKPEDINK